MTFQTLVQRARTFGAPAAINLASVLVLFMSRILVARLIGPSAFGVFAVWQNNVMLFGILGASGQQNYILKQLAHTDGRGDPEAGRIAMAALRMTLVVGLVSALAGGLFLVFFQGGAPQAAALQIVTVVAFALMITLMAIHRGLGSLTIGISFDRVVYPLAFVAFVLISDAAFAQGADALAAFAAAIALALGGSMLYLRNTLGPGIRPRIGWKALIEHAKRVRPFFVVACLFVVNGRYLLAFAGFLVDGDLLGEVALIFMIASIIAVPTATMDLVLGPALARRLTLGDRAGRAALLYIALLSAIIVVGGVGVYLVYPLIFQLSGIAPTIDPLLVQLLTATIAMTLVGNVFLLIEQFRGTAAAIGPWYAALMALKLVSGYIVGSRFGLEALAWGDLALGTLFTLLLLGRNAPLLTEGLRRE